MSPFVAFITGILTVFIFIAFFKQENEDGEILISMDEDTGTSFTTKTKFWQLSCQSCRKIKNHRELSDRVFECVGCKRRTYLT
jgi:hypothetical protein